MQTQETLFIDGQWIAPAIRATIDVISPHTEEVIARVPEGCEADIDHAVAAARTAFDEGPWPRMSGPERAEVMGRLLAALQQRADVMATTITREMGCPISFSHMGQVMAATMVLDYFTRLAREFAFADVRQGMLGPSLVRREPVGVCGAILPWNVPQFIIAMKMGAALAAGCTVVIKPAPETPLDTREEIFGPVVVVIPYESEAEAVRIANDSDYGLSGSVWTADVDHGLEVAKQVRTGTYTVNGFTVEFSAPFGGYKCSGIGRELGPEGLSAFLESKAINLPMGYEVRAG